MLIERFQWTQWTSLRVHCTRDTLFTRFKEPSKPYYGSDINSRHAKAADYNHLVAGSNPARPTHYKEVIDTAAGPCGGVRTNGHCEVKPEMKCIWVLAFERSLKMPRYGNEILLIHPPVNRQLEGTVSWISILDGIGGEMLDGWLSARAIAVIPLEMEQVTQNQWKLKSDQAAAKSEYYGLGVLQERPN